MAQERAQVTRSKIVTGAAHAFYRYGYSKTSLTDITEEAGVTKGALYFHFDSKAAVAEAVIEAQLQITHRSAELLRKTGKPAIETMIMIMINTADELQHNPVVQAGIRLRTEVSSFQSAMAESYFGDWFRSFEALAERAHLEGDLRPTVSTTALAHFLVPTFIGVELVSALLTSRTDLYQRVREMWEILLPAILVEGRDDVLRRLPELTAPARIRATGGSGQGEEDYAVSRAAGDQIAVTGPAGRRDGTAG